MMASRPTELSEARSARPKLLYFVAEDWYFCSHRLPLAVAARRSGFDVVVVTRTHHHARQITAKGLRLVPIELSRHGMNPLRDLPLIRELVRIYRTERPDIVHHVGIKPILYGSIAAYLANVSGVVNAFAGLGYLYVSNAFKARVARTLTEVLLRWILRRLRTRTIVQNPDDGRRLIDAGICSTADSVLIGGAGVDVKVFAPSNLPRESPPLVILASRMLWAKGAGDFVDMARQLRAAGVVARFVLVGESDRQNPDAVPEEQLRAWQHEGVVEWWGQRADMPEVFAQSTVVCLPSTYGEGVPKVLIEAAACGRALVAYDVPGCREIVRHGVNGLLVPPRSMTALTQAVRTLLEAPDRAETFGREGRRIAVEEFDERRVISRTLETYNKLVADT